MLFNRFSWSNRILLALLLLAGCLFAARQQSAHELRQPAVKPAGIQFAARPLPDVRVLHATTLLPNGQVLVAGGSANGSDNSATNSAFLYTPTTGLWTEIAGMKVSRKGHFAALLQNGKVLVGGGKNSNGILTSAELFDPATQSWTLTGSMTKSRFRASASLLSYASNAVGNSRNGFVLAVGGESDNSTILDTAEHYDPAAGIWKQTATKLFQSRVAHTATLLTNGDLLVTGGHATPFNPLTSAEIYDPLTDKWKTTDSLKTARFGHSATLLANGQVLVAGGIATNGTALDSAETFDLATRKWTVEPNKMTTLRAFHTASLLPTGTVFVLGGFTSLQGEGSNKGEIYSPTNKQWIAAGTFGEMRGAHTATLLANARVLAIGGASSASLISALATAELHDPAVGQWLTQINSPNQSRYNHTATLLANGKVLVAGGSDFNGAMRFAELYDPATDTWTRTGDMLTSRTSHTATLLRNGKVLVTGGVQAGGSILDSAELFDPATGAWSATTNLMPNKRTDHTATLMADGRVLVTGGWNLSPSTNILKTCDIYDPAANSWTSVNGMNQARRFHTATLLYDGRLLVVGGDTTPTLMTSETFDPATGRWTQQTSTMHVGHYRHTATLLPNGRVLIVSGLQSSSGLPTAYSGSANLFDPAGQGKWDSVTAPNGRDGHTATLLPNGKALIVGGYTIQSSGGSGSAINNVDAVELYDPGKGTSVPFSGTTNITFPRDGHSATLLPNGRVLVVGGRAQTTASNGSTVEVLINQVELYDIGLNALPTVAPAITSVNWNGSGNAACISGIRFQGGGEAASGNANSSNANYPVVQLMRLDNEQIYFLSPDANSTQCTFKGWSNNSYASLTVPATTLPGTNNNLLPGPAMMTVFSNGVPSSRAFILAPGAALGGGVVSLANLIGRIHTVADSGLQVNVELRSSTGEVRNIQSGPNGEFVFEDVPTKTADTAATDLSPSQITEDGPTTTVTVTGNGFTSNSVVLFNGQQLATTLLSSTQVRGTVLSQLIQNPGFASIVVRTIIGNEVINTAPLILQITASSPATRPNITSLSPASTVVNVSPGTITINGTNLLNGTTQVLWNGQAREIQTSQSTSTKLVFAANSADFTKPGTASVQVVNAGGTSNTSPFTITATPIPTISSLSPSSTIVGTTLSEITIAGTNLINANGTTQVLWNGQSRTINANSSSATKLIFIPLTSDFLTVGTATVRVLHTTAGVQTFSNILSFSINQQPVPTISSLTPTSTTVPITTNNSILDLPVGVIGSNFASNSVVRINGKQLTTTFVNSTRLNVNVPGALIATQTSLNFSVLNPTTNLTSNVVSFPINRTTPDTVGSVLAYPLYNSTCTTTGTAVNCSTNTTISITNTNAQQTARVRFFFVEATTGIANNIIRTINPNQTLTFLASDVNPSQRGYVLAVAINNSNCPTVFNFLRGSETVTTIVNQRTYSGSVNAIPIRGIVAPTCTASSTSATLSFNGSGYDRFPSQVVADNVTTSSSSTGTLLVVNAVGGNLVGSNRASNFAAPGTLLGQVVDASLNSFSFTDSTTSSQIFTELSRAYPRTSPSFDQIIPSGQTGKLAMYAGPGLFGMTLFRSVSGNSATLLRTVAFKTPTVVIPVNNFVITFTDDRNDAGTQPANIEREISQPINSVQTKTGEAIFSATSANAPTTTFAGNIVQQQQPGAPISYTITPSGKIATGEPIVFVPQSRTVTPGGSGTISFNQTAESPEQAVNNNFCGQTSPGLSIAGRLSMPVGYTSELIPVNLHLTNNRAPSCQLLTDVQTTSLANSGNYVVPDDLMDDVLGLEGSYEITPTDNRFLFSSQAMGQEGETTVLVPPLTGASLGWNFSATAASVCPSAASLSATANGVADLQTCAGQPINLSVPAVPNATTYTWILPGNTMVAGRTPTINNPTTGTYRVQVSVPSCAIVEASVQVTVNPTASANAGTDQSKAKTGESTSFNLAGLVSAGATVVWSQISSTGDAEATIADRSSVTSQVNVTGTGTVTLQLTAASQTDCGTANDTVVLTVSNQVLCPTVGGVSLPSALPGADVSITGTNFTGATDVRFNGLQAVFSVVNDTTINATVPPGATSGPITVSKTGCTDAAMSINILPSYEADVTPRPTGNGNGIVTVADWVQIGLFIANPGLAKAGSEFQRADCAPLATSGDGQLTMSDWVQAGRFAAALDPIPSAGGQASTASLSGLSIPHRSSLFAVRNLDELRQHEVPATVRLATLNHQAMIFLDATGEENAVGFSLTFDRTKWRIVSVTRGTDAENAMFNVSNLKIADNSVGVGVALKAGQTWQFGERQLAVINFAPVAENSGELNELAFADFPIAREVVSEKASPLLAGFKVNGVEQLSVTPSVDFGLAEMLPGQVALAALSSHDLQRRLPPARETRWQIMLRDSSGVEHRIHFFDASSEQVQFQIPYETSAGIATVFIKSSTGWTGVGSLMIGQR
ncbi:MAG: kelch repeat-containing protein [Acidobacteriota bacterium]|nr:kelch repeat-containing protein [Acidobacteriota bacterium]